MNLPRRTLLTTLWSSAIALAFARARGLETRDPEATLAAIERQSGGRLGFCALEVASGRTLSHRGDERFGLCSTFKLPLAALALRAADQGTLRLDDTIAFGAADMVPHAPVTSLHLAAGRMTIETLAKAAQETSDNVAANLLLRHLGGPAAVTRQWRGLGDPSTRLDRIEPAMNLVPAGEVRDTTTPDAMARLVARLFDGHTLRADSAARLKRWMVDTQTGLTRLRAGFPKDWQSGDKTGTAVDASMPNKHNDVAVVWRDAKPVLVVAAYYEADGHYAEMRAADNTVLASAAACAASWFSGRSARDEAHTVK